MQARASLLVVRGLELRLFQYSCVITRPQFFVLRDDVAQTLSRYLVGGRTSPEHLPAQRPNA